MSTLRAMTYVFETKDWYLCFEGRPLKKMPENLTRDFCEAIEVQRRVFETRTWKGFYKIGKGFFKIGKQRMQDEK